MASLRGRNNQFRGQATDLSSPNRSLAVDVGALGNVPGFLFESRQETIVESHVVGHVESLDRVPREVSDLCANLFPFATGNQPLKNGSTPVQLP